mmetsp:Transcript_20257/g.47890  ORF Transcript_20257/g.47890 Transcript_20257/m.47890 type:complete len:259 (-) Transcript_20257:1186-1962(-)
MPTHASPTALSCSRSLCACHCGISVHSTKCANTRESGASAAGRGGGPAGPCSGPADPSAALSESAAAAASSGEAAGAAAEGRSGEGVALWRRLATSQSPRRNSSCVSSTSSNCASSCAAESGAAGSTMRYRFSAVAVRTSETLMPDGIRPVSRSSKANSRQRAVRSGAGCLECIYVSVPLSQHLSNASALSRGVACVGNKIRREQLVNALSERGQLSVACVCEPDYSCAKFAKQNRTPRRMNFSRQTRRFLASKCLRE